MIRSKHGSISKRVGALLCALAFVLHLAFVPLRARAFAGVLPAVGAGFVVTAALMASGIYPYEDAKDFADYVADNLSSLWQQYIDSFEDGGTPSGGTITTLSQIKGYLTQGVIAIEHNVWDALSGFTSWIVSHFNVADNQTGVQLGVVSSGYLPVYNSAPSVSTLVSTGLYVGGYYLSGNVSRPRYYYAGASVDGVLAVRNANQVYFFGARALPSELAYYAFSDNASVSSNSLTQWDIFSYDGREVCRYFSAGTFSFFADGLPYWDGSAESIVQLYYGVSGTLSGVTADTTAVSALPALPSDVPWGGLAVEGTGTAATVGAVEHVIQDGVTEREKPEVKVVEVELGAGTDIDTETGEVMENPVVVTPDVVIPAVSELTAPQAFLDTLQSAMQTKFPFCLPFDIMRVLSALSRQPQAPLIKLTFHDNFSDADYTIEVDLSPWNGVAAIVREMQSILLLLGFWLNFDKFNVLNIILGQLG